MAFLTSQDPPSDPMVSPAPIHPLENGDSLRIAAC